MLDGYSRTLDGICPDCMKRSEFLLVRALKAKDKEGSVVDAWECQSCGYLQPANDWRMIQDARLVRWTLWTLRGST